MFNIIGQRMRGESGFRWTSPQVFPSPTFVIIFKFIQRRLILLKVWGKQILTHIKRNDQRDPKIGNEQRRGNRPRMNSHLRPVQIQPGGSWPLMVLIILGGPFE